MTMKRTNGQFELKARAITSFRTRSPAPYHLSLCYFCLLLLVPFVAAAIMDGVPSPSSSFSLPSWMSFFSVLMLAKSESGPGHQPHCVRCRRAWVAQSDGPLSYFLRHSLQVKSSYIRLSTSTVLSSPSRRRRRSSSTG